jgi:hypothetical protein
VCEGRGDGGGDVGAFVAGGFWVPPSPSRLRDVGLGVPTPGPSRLREGGFGLPEACGRTTEAPAFAGEQF